MLRDFSGLSRLTVAHIQDKHIEQLGRGNSQILDLPDSDTVNNGPTQRKPDNLEPSHVAMALCEPNLSYNKFAQTFSIGTHKVKRVKNFADNIRQWAIEHGYDSVSFQ